MNNIVKCAGRKAMTDLTKPRAIMNAQTSCQVHILVTC